MNNFNYKKKIKKEVIKQYDSSYLGYLYSLKENGITQKVYLIDDFYRFKMGDKFNEFEKDFEKSLLAGITEFDNTAIPLIRSK